MSVDEGQSGLHSEMLEEMIRIRTFEERVQDLFADNEFSGFVHLYIGQEAVASGACATIEDDDSILAAARRRGRPGC